MAVCPFGANARGVMFLASALQRRTSPGPVRAFVTAAR
jgi:hypothetical protein